MKFLKFWFPVAAYLGIIFYVSSIPKLKSPVEFFPCSDKIMHVLEYAVLGLLFSRALSNTRPQLSRRSIIIRVVLFCLGYGLSDEFHQLFVMGREASLGDALADVLGGSAGGWIYDARKIPG